MEAEIPVFVHLLMDRQTAFGDTDAEFADRLKVDRETWRQLRVGRTPSVKTLRRILAAYPDLYHTVMLFLAPSNANMLTVKDDIRSKVKAS